MVPQPQPANPQLTCCLEGNQDTGVKASCSLRRSKESPKEACRRCVPPCPGCGQLVKLPAGEGPFPADSTTPGPVQGPREGSYVPISREGRKCASSRVFPDAQLLLGCAFCWVTLTAHTSFHKCLLSVKDKTKVSPTLQTLCGRVPPSPSLHGNHRSSSFSSPPAYNSAARDDVLSLAAQNGTELVCKKWKLFSSYELLFIKGRKRDEKKFTFTATSPANSKQCQAKETYEKQMVESRACKPPEKPQPRSSPPVLTCWAVPVSRAGFPAGPPSSGALMIRLRECSAGQALSSSPSDKEDVAFHLHIYRTLFRF